MQSWEGEAVSMTPGRVLELINQYRSHWNHEPCSVYVHPKDDPGVGVVDTIPIIIDVNCPRGGFVLGDRQAEHNMREWLGDELYEELGLKGTRCPA